MALTNKIAFIREQLNDVKQQFSRNEQRKELLKIIHAAEGRMNAYEMLKDKDIDRAEVRALQSSLRTAIQEYNRTNNVSLLTQDQFMDQYDAAASRTG